MSFISGEGKINAAFHPVATTDEAVMGSGSIARFAAPGSATEGRFGLFEYKMPPRAAGPGPHFHKTFSESFYILSGTVRLFDGERWVDAAPGDFLYVPQNGVHAFRNDGDEAADMLLLFAPAPPREKYFRALAEIAADGRTLTEEEWTRLFAEHDQYRA